MCKLLRWVLISCLAVGSSGLRAAPILELDSITFRLVGARGVIIDGKRYDLKFIEGSCAAVFNGCDSNSDFDFPDLGDAFRAAEEILNQVLVDGSDPGTRFDTRPELTYGCEQPTACDLLIPNWIENGTRLVTSWAENWDDELSDSPTSAQFLTTSYDTSLAAHAVWAKFTPVTLPTTLWCLGIGLLGVAGVRSRSLRKTC